VNTDIQISSADPSSGKIANLFSKTRYSIAEEDRVVNAMSLALQRLPSVLIAALFNRLSVPISPDELPRFDDHVAMGPESIVDLVIEVPAKAIVFLEAKIVPGQFDDPEQAQRYWQLLQARSEMSRALLLVSPDDDTPKSVSELRSLNAGIRVVWLSWNEIADAFSAIAEEVESPIARFLVDEFVGYLEVLGLLRKVSTHHNDSRVEPQLKSIINSVAVEKVLLHIYQHGQAHMSAVKRDHMLGAGETHRAFARLVSGQLLERRRQGNLVVYQFNDRNPLIPPLLDLLRVAYQNIARDERRAAFSPQYRP
jgi:hypothetical protein